jgi:hypothetical protein
MHTAILLAAGLGALALFVAGARALGRPAADGARYFILPWLAVALVNFYVGTFHVGVAVSVELAVLAVVFGVPAGVAWFLWRRGAR